MIKQKKKAVIIGAGWIGSKVFKELKKNGLNVFATYHSKIPQNGKEFIQFTLGDALSSQLKHGNYYLISIAPRLRNKTPDEQKLIVQNHEKLIHDLPADSHVIYTSSTSVYSETGELDESSSISGPIASIEKLIQAKFKNYTILRLGGLAGDDRYIVNHLAKKGIINFSKNNTNLIHSKDVVHSIKHCFQEGIYGIFNLCAPLHPTKGETYQKWSKKLLNKELPVDGKTSNNKIVNPEKWLNRSKKVLFYPDPLFFDFEAIN